MIRLNGEPFLLVCQEPPLVDLKFIQVIGKVAVMNQCVEKMSFKLGKFD